MSAADSMSAEVNEMKLTLDVLREAKRQLVAREVKPRDGNWIGLTVPKLRDGVVWLGACAFHPYTYLDIRGPEEFLKLDSDVSKRRMENFVKGWRKQNAARLAR
jgi:hypothetical protein